MPLSGWERVHEALEANDLVRGGYGKNIMASCPGPLHGNGDRRPSLSIGEGDDGRALVYCHVGCSLEDIVDGLGLEMADLFTDHQDRIVVAQYVYTDADGEPVFRVNRTSDKGFFQERYEDGEWKLGLDKNAPRPLYNLVEVNKAPVVHVVEGEKDVETLRMLDLVGTTFMGGAGKWDATATEALRGKRVVIVRDNDEPGTKHALMVEEALEGVASLVEVMAPARGKDVTDAVNAGDGPFLVPLSGVLALEEFTPLDWEHYEVEDTEWLYKPYIPRGGRTLVFGEAGSLKSLWAMWVAAKLAKDGGRVAYFSLEMLPSQAVGRLRRFAPPQENFLLLSNLKLGSPTHLALITKALKGYDLIVVDSWNSSYQFSRNGGTSDDQVAALDREFFLPMVEETGATLMILDNTGHASMTKDGPVKQEHARGSSAKGDKMDTTIWLDRPYADNNYLTKVTVKKMRFDFPIPEPRLVIAPSDCDPIEFFYVDEAGLPAASAWTGEPTEDVIHVAVAPVEAPAPPDLSAMLAIARIKDKFKEVVEE